MPILVGLDGVRRPHLTCVSARTIDQVVRRIQRRRAVSVAGSTGAFNVWRDDDGKVRSEFMRYRRSLDKATHEDAASLTQWLQTWWPQLEAEGEV